MPEWWFRYLAGGGRVVVVVFVLIPAVLSVVVV
jgi:hypothetical protein